MLSDGVIEIATTESWIASDRGAGKGEVDGSSQKPKIPYDHMDDGSPPTNRRWATERRV